MFYYMAEFFDPDLMHSSIEYADKDDKCCIVGKANGNAYLNKIVSSGKHHWRFKLVHCYNSPEIGIANNDDTNKDAGIFTDDGSGYAYLTAYEVITDEDGTTDQDQHYGEECREGDIIDMYVDFEKFQIRYSVNDKDYGVAFTIKPGKYRAAVSLQSSPMSTKLRLEMYEQL